MKGNILKKIFTSYSILAFILPTTIAWFSLVGMVGMAMGGKESLFIIVIIVLISSLAGGFWGIIAPLCRLRCLPG